MLECVACNRSLPESDFYASNRSRCRACCLEYMRAYRAKRRAESAGSRSPDWKRKTADIAAYRRAWAAAHPGYATRKKREWLERNADRARARARYRDALKSGRLVRQPCEVCGAEKVDGHHDDYSKPLEVRWLCREHHLQAHRRVK